MDVKGFRTDRKTWLRDEILAMTGKHFEVVRYYLAHADWDYFQFVEIGLDRVHHGFWQFYDPRHVDYEPGNPFASVIPDYYRLLDEELGRILESLTEDTVLLVVSDHGAMPLDGGFCVNEWLVREGLLVLHEHPTKPTPFAKLDVNWRETKAWGEGGYYARIFLNVRGREPDGALAPEDCLTFRDELATRLRETRGPDGEPLGTLVFKPEEVYRDVKNIPPDLVVHFGGLRWRSIGGVGYGTVHTRENDTGPDGCNHAQFGAFILAGPNVPLEGEVKGVHLLDIAPTLLELGSYDVPAGMQGRSLAGEAGAGNGSARGRSARGEELVRERLRGLGYIP